MKIEKSRLGMALFLLSEAVFFIMLILAYVYFHDSPEGGVNVATVLDVPKTGVFTAFLLSSSLTMWLAGKSLKQGQRMRLRFWLTVTILFGAVFLAGQGREYLDLIGRNVTISQGLFGTTFFTLTGFHGLHVFFGLILLGIVLSVVWTRGRIERTQQLPLSAARLAAEDLDRQKEAATLETIALYWHFVDVVWVFIFSVVYLWAVL